jgi:hypothetical protein
MQMDPLQVEPKGIYMEREPQFCARSPATLLHLSFPLATNVVSPHSSDRIKVNAYLYPALHANDARLASQTGSSSLP